MSRPFSNLKQNAPPSGKTVACRTFQQELPSLCRAPATYSRWVLFVRDELVDVGETKRDLILKCNSKRLSPSEYFIGYVDEASADDFESGEINAWISEDVRGEEAVE